MRRLITYNLALLLMVIAFSGCAGSQFLLNGKEKTINLDQDHGLVLFSSQFNTLNAVNLQQCAIREVNQYKSYKELTTYLIPIGPNNYDATKKVFILPLVLPKGKYILQQFVGMISVNWLLTYQAGMFAGTVFDVQPGEMTYTGRLIFNSLLGAQQGMSVAKIEDNYDEDVGMAKNHFPALVDKKFLKDSFYH